MFHRLLFRYFQITRYGSSSGGKRSIVITILYLLLLWQPRSELWKFMYNSEFWVLCFLHLFVILKLNHWQLEHELLVQTSRHRHIELHHMHEPRMYSTRLSCLYLNNIFYFFVFSPSPPHFPSHSLCRPVQWCCWACHLFLYSYTPYTPYTYFSSTCFTRYNCAWWWWRRRRRCWWSDQFSSSVIV